MNDENQELFARFIELVQRLTVQVRSGALEEWPDPDLTMSQFRTLILLSRGSQRMSTIATFLETSLSSATSLVDRLVSKRLVERVPDPTDRRVVLCELTALGANEVQQIWRVRRGWIEEVGANMTADELRSVVTGLEILTRAFQRDTRAPSSKPRSNGTE